MPLAVDPPGRRQPRERPRSASPWRPCTLLPQLAQRPTPTANFRGDRAHLGQLDLELLGSPLVLDLPATVRAARRQRYVRLSRSWNADGSHSMTMATMSITAFVVRGRAGSSFGSPLENGAALALARTAGSPAGAAPARPMRASRWLRRSFSFASSAVLRSSIFRRLAISPNQLLVGVGL